MLAWSLRISRAKQNREFKGREYQLQAKIYRTKLLLYFELYGLIRQNKTGQNNFAC